MSYRAKFYDPDQVNIKVGGQLIDGGWADGEFCTFEMTSNAFENVVGTNGEVARSKQNDRTATLVLKLLQTSSYNQYFSGLHSLDLNAPGGLGVVPVEVFNLLSGEMFRSTQAWITKLPPVSMDRTAKAREWNFMCANATVVVSGNII